jgi:hypothetical protein
MADHLHRPTLRRAPAFAVAALLALPVPAGALADIQGDDGSRAALATERYYSSYGEPADSRRPPVTAERYYSSYGTRESPAAPTASAPAIADGGPGWATAIIAGGLLVAAAAGLGVQAGRASMRPRPGRARPSA